MLANQRKLYPLLFDCAAQSLLEFGRNRLHGDLGITAVLHTWGQKLDFHPHLHCIVTGGALSPDGKQWRSPKQRKFLFPVRALAALFRGKFLAGLAQMLDAGELHLPDLELQIPGNRTRWFSLLYRKHWVLYAKRPFGGPKQVLSYLANYTHRVALSNRRIVAVDARHQTVTFTYRDYRRGSLRKDLTLSALEFIRRFSLHILPPGLVRIRHYGILGNNRRKHDIEAARAIFISRGHAVESQPRSVANNPMCCPSCRKAGIRLVAFTDAAGVLHMIGAGPMHAIPHEHSPGIPKTELDSCVSSKTLSGYARLSQLSSCPCEAPLSRSEVTGVAQLQLSIFWREFNPAFQGCWLLAR
jgi:hypothetical protein